MKWRRGWLTDCKIEHYIRSKGKLNIAGINWLAIFIHHGHRPTTIIIQWIRSHKRRVSVWSERRLHSSLSPIPTIHSHTCDLDPENIPIWLNSLINWYRNSLRRRSSHNIRRRIGLLSGRLKEREIFHSFPRLLSLSLWEWVEERDFEEGAIW